MKKKNLPHVIAPQIVLRNGKPSAVILDIREYQEMLERLEDAHDLRRLRSMRRGPCRFRALSDVLAELKAGA